MTATVKQAKIPKPGNRFLHRTVIAARRRRRDGAVVCLTVWETGKPYQIWVITPKGAKYDTSYHYFSSACEGYRRVSGARV